MARFRNVSILRVVIAHAIALSCGISNAQQMDPREGGAKCKELENLNLACEYRYSSKIEVKNLELSLGSKPLDLKKEQNRSYPVGGQTTAVLILADVSDPARKETVEKKYPAVIHSLLQNAKEHQKVALAEFDSGLRVILPFNSPHKSIEEAAKELRAKGASTEFYKNILSAIDLLKKQEAERKVLVILSDGKDEDRAYQYADVAKEAKNSQVIVMGLGFLERQRDEPYLQTLERLANETYGVFANATQLGLPKEFIEKPFGFAEKGGTIEFPSEGLYGDQKVSISLGTQTAKRFEIVTNVTVTDRRELQQKIIDWLATNWMWVAIGGVVVVAAVGGGVYSIQRRANKIKVVIYANISELDGMGKKYPITKSAIRIGRGVDNDIALLNGSVSQHHAEIHRRREGDFYIVDLSSTNGVYVNDTKISQSAIKNGDIIELGEVRMRFSA